MQIYRLDQSFALRSAFEAPVRSGQTIHLVSSPHPSLPHLSVQFLSNRDTIACPNASLSQFIQSSLINFFIRRNRIELVRCRLVWSAGSRRAKCGAIRAHSFSLLSRLLLLSFFSIVPLTLHWINAIMDGLRLRPS